MKRSTRVFLAAALMGSLASAALAEPEAMIHQTVVGQTDTGEARQRVVSYAGLDVDHSVGAAALYGRITRAAQFVCDMPQARNLEIAAHVRHCAADATARAVSDVNSPALTQYYEARSSSLPVYTARR